MASAYYRLHPIRVYNIRVQNLNGSPRGTVTQSQSILHRIWSIASQDHTVGQSNIFSIINLRKHIKGFVLPHLEDFMAPRILHIGCGNSRLAVDLIEAGSTLHRTLGLSRYREKYNPHNNRLRKTSRQVQSLRRRIWRCSSSWHWIHHKYWPIAGRHRSDENPALSIFTPSALACQGTVFLVCGTPPQECWYG